MFEINSNSCEGYVTKNHAFFLCLICKRSEILKDYYCSEEQYKKNNGRVIQSNSIDKEVNDN